jgi:hypothetical protein
VLAAVHDQAAGVEDTAADNDVALTENLAGSTLDAMVHMQNIDIAALERAANEGALSVLSQIPSAWPEGARFEGRLFGRPFFKSGAFRWARHRNFRVLG